MKAIIFGEVIWDVYPDKKTIGGAPFNFGANLALAGNEVYLVTAVGKDDLGNDALVKATEFGIHTHLIQKNDYPTGQCTVTLDENKVPSYYVHENAAYDNIEVTEEMIEKIKELDADVFYFNSLIQRNEVSKKSLLKILDKCSFKEIFCDINIREGCFDKGSLLVCMEKSTTVKISDEELHYLYDMGILDESKKTPEDICKAFPNIKTLVFTKGEKGSEVYNAINNKTYHSTEVPKVEVLSTVGAGDCYGATFLDCVMKGESINEAIAKATMKSANVVASYEAIVITEALITGKIPHIRSE